MDMLEAAHTPIMPIQSGLEATAYEGILSPKELSHGEHITVECSSHMNMRSRLNTQ